MDQTTCPCSIGIVRDPSALVGNCQDLGGGEVFYCTLANNPSEIGVVVIHDIFGFRIPNSKYIVDYLAKQGLHAIMPDCYAGEGLEPWGEGASFSSDEFKPWIASITTPEFFDRVTQRSIRAAEILKAQGCKQVAVIGFCWGGKAATVTAESGAFSASVSIHGARHSLDCITKAKCPVFFVTVPNDHAFSDELQKSIVKFGEEQPEYKSAIKIYEGGFHGFVVRGDFSDDKLRALADEAMQDTVHFIQNHAL